MNSSKKPHARVETGRHADRLRDEHTSTDDARRSMLPDRARQATDAVADLERYAALKAHLESAGYTLRHTSDGIFIVARWNLSRTLNDLDEAERFLRRVAP